MNKKKLLSLSAVILSSNWLFAQGTEHGPIDHFPNYHPMVVHFPIILLLLAALMQVVNLFIKNKVFNVTIILFTVIGFITGLLSATVFHAHAAETVSSKAMELFEAHEKLAYITIWLSGFASLFKIAGLFLTKKWIEVIALLLLLCSALTVIIAGHRGAELVYKQGIGPKGEKLETEH